MTYFELLNKVLLELGLNQLDKFENAYKNEHFRILEALKVANRKLCMAFEWDFLLSRKVFEAQAGETTLQISDLGKVVSIKRNGKKLQFDKNFIKRGCVLNGAGFWANFGKDKIEIFPSDEQTELEIVYLTNNYAIAQDGTPRANFTEKEDRSVLPEIANRLIVYSACMQVKPPTSPKYGVWERFHNSIMSDLVKSQEICEENGPKIRVLRAQCRF